MWKFRRSEATFSRRTIHWTEEKRKHFNQRIKEYRAYHRDPESPEAKEERIEYFRRYYDKMIFTMSNEEKAIFAEKRRQNTQRYRSRLREDPAK